MVLPDKSNRSLVIQIRRAGANYLSPFNCEFWEVWAEMAVHIPTGLNLPITLSEWELGGVFSEDC